MVDCGRHLLSSWGRRRRLSDYFLQRLDRQSGQSCPRDALPKILQIVPIFVVAYSSQIRRRPGLRKAFIHFPRSRKSLGTVRKWSVCVRRHHTLLRWRWRPQLNNTIFAGIASKDFFVGTLGLAPRDVNFTGYNYPVPSILTSLKTAGYIDSVSWADTAGAYYTPK